MAGKKIKDLDSLFDIADDAVDALSSVLGPAEASHPNAPDDVEPEQTQAIDVQGVWKRDVKWAPCRRATTQAVKPGQEVLNREAWHAFEKQVRAPLKAICGESFQIGEAGHMSELSHGKRIIVCTSCVIGVSK